MANADFRSTERFLLDRCLEVVVGVQAEACDEREANFFRLAAIVIESRSLDASERLRLSAVRYFQQHETRPLGVEEVFDRGWILGLPRLRDMLTEALRQANVRC